MTQQKNNELRGLPTTVTANIDFININNTQSILFENNKIDRLFVVVTKHSIDAINIHNGLKTLLQTDSFLFPSWETLPYDSFSPSGDETAARLSLLSRLAHLKSGIIITSIDAIIYQLCPQNYIDANVLDIKLGDEIGATQLAKQLHHVGYELTSTVTEKGQYAVRGSIIDIFPPDSPLPIRLDFFDDEVEQLRLFDVKTQLTLNKIDAVHIIPSKEVDLSDAGRTCFRQNMRAWLSSDKAEAHVFYQKISNNETVAGIENFLPLFFDETAHFFDYLNADYQILVDADYQDYIKQFLNNATGRFERKQRTSIYAYPAPEKLFLKQDKLAGLISSKQISPTANTAHQIQQISLKGDTESKLSLLNELIGTGANILIVAQSDGQKAILNQRLKHSLTNKTFTDWQYTGQGITIASLKESFYDYKHNAWIICGHAIFESNETEQENDSDKQLTSMINDLSQLSIGDPVVHYEHGVGRYLGLESMEIDGQISEFIAIAYDKGGKLYIPVTALEVIDRYAGASPENAPLHSLDGRQWEKAKEKASKKIYDTAVELLEIYSQRALAKTLEIKVDNEQMQSFAEKFPFAPTTDQIKTFHDVYRDLASTQPMDRIVCGDVGFGKTEVAMRAAFATVMAGQQVAILVPTTLLAEQHYQNFFDRFSDYPINIGSISRFKTAKQQAEILQQCQAGQIDIIIGTHRLIQKDFQFKNLGLVIIDEEHKFGVKQKEKLKQFRSNVNILTLTATPIPRTLSMSMSGLRDLSIIATPPKKRSPVQTVFSHYDDELISEGFEREIARGGQIYFVHNDIATIENIKHNLERLSPAIRINVAHGQMREKQLEKIMLDFYNQHFNCLLATTIIESGIDNPNANTIFINRADKFGLAQLHQLRGRVGRSHHQAYAYLITPDEKVMTNDANKRLLALASQQGLGVGFMLATHDLEIRGAGELLGDNQSGQINEIGFSLFNELLEETIDAIQHNREIDFSPQHQEIEIDFAVNPRIPDDYIYDVHSRLVLYKRISACDSEKSLDKLQMEFIDRFGLLPEPTQQLFWFAEIKLLARKLGIRKLMASDAEFTLHLSKSHQFDSDKLIGLIQKEPLKYQLKKADSFAIRHDLNTVKDRVKFIKEWLENFIKA